MMSSPRIVALLAACLALGAGGAAASAADMLTPKPEAPTTIFAVNLGSVDVDFSLLGAWTAAVSYGIGIRIAPGGTVQLLDSFPSMDQGFVFNQTPDITVSLLILKRYFLEVSILGSFTDNSIQLGYRGMPGEVVQEVVLGTQGITMDPSPLLQIPLQPAGSLGVMAKLASGAATNDLLLRWDATTRKHKTFVGKNELVEQDVALDSYTRGTYFFLPDVGLDTGTLKVLFEDPSGTYTGSDDGRYRLAGYDDVVLDSAQGLVSLRDAAKGRVLVFYQKAGAAVGMSAGATLPAQTGSVRDPMTSIPFNWALMGSYLGVVNATLRRVTVTGVGDCLLLWEPGDNSPFEIDNSYAFASTPPSDVSKISYQFFAKDASATIPSGFLFQSMPSETRFTVAPKSPATRFSSYYPFADPDGLLYGPGRDSLAGALEVGLHVQFLTPITDMMLEPKLVPGSVQVQVNGVAETRFEVDAVSGKLTLNVPVQPTDRIDVSYQKTDPGSTGGDIILAWRDQIPLSDSVTLTLSAGIRWNANPWTFSQEPYAKSGTLIAAAGIQGKADRISWSVQAGVAYTNPDTSGVLRLFGMEGTSTPVDLSEDNAYPASVPVGLFQTKRGKLFYRNYRKYDAFGAATLLPITAPDIAQMPYANGSRMGPYNVQGDSGSLGAQDLALEYELAAGEWVGAQLSVSAGSDVDLSSARSVTIRLKGTGSATVFLENGAISEDLDGSGVLNGEASSAQTGFSFVDQAHAGVTLKVGAGPKLEGNGKLDSEDRNANGIMDREDQTRVVQKPIVSYGTGWTTTTIALDDADRRALLRTRGVRMVIRSLGGESGTILVDSLVFDTAPFWPQVSALDRPKVTVRQTLESLAIDAPAAGGDFASKWGSTYKLFHPNGEPNAVLEASWTAMTAMPLAVQGFVSQGTGGIQYDTIVSYIRSPPTLATYTFSLLDAAGKGAVWSISGIDDSWHEVRVSRKNNTVTIDGASAGPPLRFDPGYGSLTQLSLSIAGPATGTVYIDEIFCADPEGSFGAGFVGSLTAAFPGTIVAVGAVPLLSNVTIVQDVSLLSAGFAPLYGIPLASEDISSRTELAADLLFARTSLNVVLRETGGAFTGYGGHRVSIPAAGSPLSFTDAFALTWSGGFSREDRLHVGAGSFLDLAMDANADASPGADPSTGLLTQSWHADASVTPFTPFTVASSLALSQAVDSYPLPLEWYGARWARETALLAPWEGGEDVHRAGTLSVKAGMPASPFGFTLEARTGADASGYTGPGFVQENQGSLWATLAAKLGPQDLPDATLSLSYSRELSLTTAALDGPRFAAETTELGRVLALQGYMLTLVPLAEIFADNGAAVLPGWGAAGKGSYKPTLTLAIQRPYGSRLLDLFLPSSLDVSVGQELARTGDIPRTLISVQPKSVTRALNLFGELGAYPLLQGIRTDEYSVSVGASLDGPPGSAPVLTSLTAVAYATLTGTNENELTLTDSLRRAQTSILVLSNDLQLLYDWKVRPKDGERLPLLPTGLAGSGYVEHRESAGLTIGYQDSGAFHPFTLVLGHATSLVYETHGSIKGSLSLGVDAENLGAAGIEWRLAVRASLEGKLTF